MCGDLPSEMPLGAVEGVGIDMVELDRIRKRWERDEDELQRLFTEAELEAVQQKEDPVPSLAARFAGKEATIKALPETPLGIPDLPDIRISTAGTGAPQITLPDSLEGGYRCLVSLTHSKHTAGAIVIVQQKRTDKGGTET